MKTHHPKVSIGLPVYNGEKYLRQSIDSILAQTFTDFELIISDNASTDNTEAICREYAAKDSRIQYYRNQKNIGGANNHNQVFALAKGQYFQWVADDDLWNPKFLEKSVKVLDCEPLIVLCFSTFIVIDESGCQISINERILGQSEKPAARLRELSDMDHHCEVNYGLIRADILRRTELELNYYDSDRTLLCELGLHGRFHIIPEPLFFRRQHPERAACKYPIYANMSFFHPELSDDNYFFFERWNQFLHYLRAIHRAPLTFEERLKCYLFIGGPWISKHSRWEGMIRELVSPIKKIILRFIKKINQAGFASHLDYK